MTPTRVAGTLAVLVLLSACSGRDDSGDSPRLPDFELADTTVGVSSYEAKLTASRGTPPLSYSLVGTPPPGFSFHPAEAKLVGPASEAGDYSITVSVLDAKGRQDTRTWALKVWPAPVVSGDAPPAATAGSSYLYTVPVTGGRPPLRWSRVEGSLPTGLSFSEEGMVSGIPQGRGTYSFTLRVEDANGARGEAQLSLEVRDPGELPDGGPADGGDSGTPDAGPRPATFPLTVANWNIEWFGDPTKGPADETLQLTNVQAVIADAGADVWGLAEIVSTPQFNELKNRLPGYDGFLANDTRVSAGSQNYSDTEQKVGVLYKSDVVQVQGAEVVLTQHGYEFAGRPPLRVDLRVTRGGSRVDLTVLVVHMKATDSSTSAEDYNRRQAAAGYIKGYLDTLLPTQRVMVVGDWNDDVDVSTVGGQASPFRNFVDDTTNYTFPTQALSLANVRSTASGSAFIDHQLASNEMMASYVPNSAIALRPTITGYRDNTSDHYPIFSRYDFGQGKALRLTAPNGGETLTAGTTYDITWTSSGVDSVRLRYSLDNGLTWDDIVASTPAAPGRYTWTVPNEASSGARVEVGDATDTSFSDASDNTFLLNRTAPRVFVNEYLPQPNYRPGTNPPAVDFDQMFVELLNMGSTAVDISGWKLHDDESFSGTKPARHVFANGTVLQPGQVYTVYSGASAVPQGATNATFANGMFEGTLQGLRFNRGKNVNGSGDSVYLVLPDGTVEDSGHYDDTYLGVSYNRSPDASATGAWVLHDTLSATLTASPGRRANGSAF
ncbi:lamin tail domain-containing protein [Pyxidicoccus sp. 3LG]